MTSGLPVILPKRRDRKAPNHNHGANHRCCCRYAAESSSASKRQSQEGACLAKVEPRASRLELTKFHNPKLVESEPAIAPPNTLGLRSVMFTVESVDDTVARLRANGAELVGEVAQYEDRYRLCYMRGPAGIIVALAEELF